jgi:hypothetical protein
VWKRRSWALFVHLSRIYHGASPHRLTCTDFPVNDLVAHAAPARRRLPWVVDFYLTVIRTAVAEQFQYRAANYAYAIGMVAEPVI